MSFSVDLWNSYEFVENNFMLHYRGLKDFIYMINERYTSEVQNANVLKRIHDMKFAVTTYDSLLEGVIGFKADMLNQYNYTSEFCSGINDELITPLMKLSESLLQRITAISNKMKACEKDYVYTIKQLDSAKNKFHSAAKAAEQAKLRCEASKQNGDISQDNKMKNEIKAQEALKIAKECENAYIGYLNYANGVQDEYIAIKKQCMNGIQDLEEELGNNIKDSLRKYVIFQVAFLRNMQYDIEKKAKLMESINIRKDIKTFINKNATNALPPYKFEFIPYVSDFDITRNQLANEIIPKDIVSNVKTFISNVFFNESPIEGDISQSKTQNEIDNMVSSIYQGKQIPDEFHKMISNFIRNKKTRKMMLNSMNQTRTKGIFTLNENSYKTIGDILIECLTVLQLERYFESIRLVINLSTTLYKTVPEAKMPRVFLNSYLEGHTIWRNEDFWKDLIKYNIIEEMHNQKNYNIYNNETAEEKDNRIQKIVENQLTSSIYNMISFDVDTSVMKRMVGLFIEDYELDDKVNEPLMKMIKDHEKRKEEKEKEDEKTDAKTDSSIK